MRAEVMYRCYLVPLLEASMWSDTPVLSLRVLANPVIRYECLGSLSPLSLLISTFTSRVAGLL